MLTSSYNTPYLVYKKVSEKGLNSFLVESTIKIIYLSKTFLKIKLLDFNNNKIISDPAIIICNQVHG